MSVANDRAVATAAFEFGHTCFDAFCDNAGGFTCREADTIVELYRVLGVPRLGEMFLDAHALDDEPDDLHYRVPTDA